MTVKQLIGCLLDSERAMKSPSWTKVSSNGQRCVLKGRHYQLKELEEKDTKAFEEYCEGMETRWGGLIK